MQQAHRLKQVADCLPTSDRSAAQGEALLNIAGLFCHALEGPLVQ